MLKIIFSLLLVVSFAPAMASWTKDLSQGAYDNGEMNLNGTGYLRFPSKKVAQLKVNEMLKADVAEQSQICTAHGGQLQESETQYTFKYESSWPYYWFCTGVKTVTCQ